jgi:hypothetical protein
VAQSVSSQETHGRTAPRGFDLGVKMAEAIKNKEIRLFVTQNFIDSLLESDTLSNL